MHEITFGDRLRVARRAVGLSQAALAARLELHQTQVSDYERGAHSPSAETLGRLASALEVSADWLLYGRRAEGEAE